MANIGFLACETTLPGSGQRRGDAYEHDLTIGALQPEMRAHGHDLQVIDWEAPVELFAGIDFVLLGTAWNYQDRADAFLNRLEALEKGGIAVCNPPEIVRWNMTKTYLRELDSAGAPTIPTRWLDRVTATDARAAMEDFDCDALVVKRQVGAGALGQELVRRDELSDDWTFAMPAMVQPFLPAIAEHGELSFVFVEGRLSHALRKRPAPGDYRIQSLYGGREETHDSTPGELDAAHAVVDALPFPVPLYARIDMLKGAQEQLNLMEVELIEPYLYPEQGPRIGAHIAAAITRRIAAS